MKIRWLLLPIMIALVPTGARADDRDENLVRELTAVIKDRLAPTWHRVEAARTLGKMGAKAGAAVPDLTVQLVKLQGELTMPLQETLVVTLGQIGSPSKTAIPTMTKLAGRDVFFDQMVRKSIDQILAASEDADESVAGFKVGGEVGLGAEADIEGDEIADAEAGGGVAVDAVDAAIFATAVVVPGVHFIET